MDLNALLSQAVEIGGSDLDRSIASPSMALIDGRLEPIDEPDRETAANPATNRHDFELAVEHALKESRAAERGDLRTVDTPGDGEKPTRLRLASP